MKRINAELQKTELIELLKEDPIGRNQEICDFLSLLDLADEGYSIFLNAPWGDGKTVFVKHSIMVLTQLNDRLQNDKDLQLDIFRDRALKKLELGKSYLPVYYNAWQNDSLGDPLPSLIATISTEFGTADDGKEGPSKSDVAVSIIDACLTPFGLNVLAPLRDGLTGKDYLEAFKEKKALQGKVRSLVDEVLDGKADKLVLFIDELDRCSPSFTLKLLEEIKFLFENDNIILVFSTDVEQLANAISGAYGREFDGEKYLERFYDRIVPLSRPSSAAYLSRLGIENGYDPFNEITHNLANRLGFSLRDSNCYIQSLEAARKLLDEEACGCLESFFLAGLIPVLQAIKIESVGDYNKVVRQAIPDPIFRFIGISEAFRSFVDGTIKDMTRRTPEVEQSEVSDEEREEFISNVCIAAFKREDSAEKRRLGYYAQSLLSLRKRVL